MGYSVSPFSKVTSPSLVREEQSPGAKVRFVEYNPLLGSASATTKIVAVYNVAGLFSFDRRLATQYHLRDGPLFTRIGNVHAQG